MPPVKGRQNPETYPLLDISTLVEVQQPFTILSDGRKRKRASAFCVDVLSDAFEGGQERCFLKIFLPDAANTACFKAECEANHALHQYASENTKVLTGKQPLEVFKTHLQLSNGKHRLSWPLCYGYISVEDPFFHPPVKKRQNGPEQPVPQLHGLLFQHYEDLTLVSPDDIDGGGVMQAKILAALAPIHAARILHRDLEERTVWPEAGFRNIFLKDGEPVILDFDHSQMIQERDEKRLQEEETQMKELMAKAVENRGREKGWGLSKEVLRLL
ncbi:hypothetical protein DFH08DRAFT_292336 [Mycena albidolilacea]|uniref:Uncharacterized protein n=1 Tax=Mycena albidolilacea TaxID=1033008 RepID=A0AAD6ZQX1_9AGAR|nr:hypothetical protein DFH08DRAFT_292336 [Mycena albidolilacea]